MKLLMHVDFLKGADLTEFKNYKRLKSLKYAKITQRDGSKEPVQVT